MNRRLTSGRLALLRASAGAATLALTTACGDSAAPTVTQESGVSEKGKPHYMAEIARTAFGIPHIKAQDEGGLGFGVGYAYAQDNFCLLAEQVMTVNGERSRHLGADEQSPGTSLSNLQTDFFYSLINDTPAVAAAWRAQPADMKAIITGYAAGYNLYLSEQGRSKLPAACKDAGWVRAISADDILKLVRSYAVEGGSTEFIGALVGAAPPGLAKKAGAAPGPLKALDRQYWIEKRERAGSNGVALGKEATDNGSGLLLGNPHFPWEGRLRFYQLHLTIPGKLDVMGASLGGLPQVNIGFNRNVAWTHTVNTSTHFSLHALQLDPADPTRYIVDGTARAMSRKSVVVQVRDADGVVRPRQQDFYASTHGYVINHPQLPWTGGMAFALNDPNLDNHRMLQQWNAVGRASNVAELKAAVDGIVGMPWVNTLAADRHGKTLYMDVTVVPHVTHAKEAACVSEPFKPLASFGVMVLDASTSACALGNDRGAPQPGIFAGTSMPRLERTDYVQNSNDSAWLSNPAAPLTGFPTIVSIDGTAQQPRTRLGITQLRARLGGTDGKAGKRMSMTALQELTLSNRVYYADLMVADVLRACGGRIELADGCTALAQWDRSANLDANLGYAYFGGVWRRIWQTPNVWAVPFDPADPVNTPRGLNVSNPNVAAVVRNALAESVQEVASMGVPAMARWGDLQGVMRGEQFIPVHGGDGVLGVYNAIDSMPGQDGRLHVVMGSSYLQTVTFDANGPRAQAMLSYSQSTNPASPHYADQTQRFSNKAWITQVFTPEQIKADPQYRRISISARR